MQILRILAFFLTLNGALAQNNISTNELIGTYGAVLGLICLSGE